MPLTTDEMIGIIGAALVLAIVLTCAAISIIGSIA